MIHLLCKGPVPESVYAAVKHVGGHVVRVERLKPDMNEILVEAPPGSVIDDVIAAHERYIRTGTFTLKDLERV